MPNFSEHTQNQAAHYDKNHPINPFETLLRQTGYTFVYRPKDLKIKQTIQTAITKPGMQLLDLGCASGLLVQRVQKTFDTQGTGIDVSGVLLNKARELDSVNKYVYASATELPFADNSFDIITSIDNLEHIQEYPLAIAEAARVLKPGGTLIIDTINKNNKYTIDWLLELAGQDYHLKRAGHTKDLFFDPKHIAEICEKNGLKNIHIYFYDATFTIITNTIFLIILMISDKLLTPIPRARKLVLKIMDNASKIIAPLVNEMDKPFTSRGYSNAFFIVANK